VIANPTTGLSADYFAQGAIEDFNGDGKLDVACGAGDFLLLGNGDGTFQAPLLSLGFDGTEIAAGDFNGDGRPDLAVGGVAVLLNIGQGFRGNDTTAVVSSHNPNVTFTGDAVRLGHTDGHSEFQGWFDKSGIGIADERKRDAEYRCAGSRHAQHHSFVQRGFELSAEHIRDADADCESGTYDNDPGVKRESVVLGSECDVYSDCDVKLWRGGNRQRDIQARK